VVRNVTKTEAFAAAFSVSGLKGSAMPAAAMWRPTTAAINTAAVNSAQHQTVSQNLKLATLHTQIKQYVVTTPDTGRGNKGTSPWGFPV
jgi:hypothetical protein